MCNEIFKVAKKNYRRGRAGEPGFPASDEGREATLNLGFLSIYIFINLKYKDIFIIKKIYENIIFLDRS
jgi:hypothetical protein